jgi:hypothetical protein
VPPRGYEILPPPLPTLVHFEPLRGIIVHDPGTSSPFSHVSPPRPKIAPNHSEFGAPSAPLDAGPVRMCSTRHIRKADGGYVPVHRLESKWECWSPFPPQRCIPRTPTPGYQANRQMFIWLQLGDTVDNVVPTARSALFNPQMCAPGTSGAQIGAEIRPSANRAAGR